uniref:Carboxypeptidase activation peptide domain-containing protein n=1 Tax=Panagrolaimus sp. ES5 TaxID=591445 RepID=A0AC34GGR5_9BILA
MRHVFLISLLIIGLNAFAVPKPSEDYVTYQGYSVIRVIPHTEEQLMLVYKLSETLKYDFDFWKPPSKLNKPVDIFSPPTMTRQLIAHLKKGSLMPVTKIRDFGERVAAAHMEVASYISSDAIDPDSFDFYKYHPFADIMGYI